MWTVGVDIGGTKIKIGIVSSTGEIAETVQIKTDVEGGVKAIVDQVGCAVNQLLRESAHPCNAVGVGTPGQVDKERGVVGHAPNLKWLDVPLKDLLKEKITLPVVVLNDVRAAMWGEWIFGAARGASDVVTVFLGTGIGGGIIASSKVIDGATSCAGEVGHFIVRSEGRLCGCGNRGCIEAYAGGWALKERAQEAAKNYPQEAKMMIEMAGGKLDHIDSQILSLAVLSKDPLALRIEEETLIILRDFFIGLIHAMNPELIIIGGGVLQGFPSWISRLEDRIKERAFPFATKNLKMLPGYFGTNAGMVGAAAYASQHI